MAARGNPLRATPFAHFPAHSACIGTWKRGTSRTSYLIHLSTAADSNRGNRSWVNIQSAGWVNIQSARTIHLDLTSLSSTIVHDPVDAHRH